MVNKLCTKCKTGADSLKLDPKNAMCPHIQFHNGKTCELYVPLKRSEVNDDERV